MNNKSPCKLYTLSAVIVGLLLIDESSPKEQNALGNWLMLVAQVICTNAYFVDLKDDNNINEKDTIIMIKKMIDVLNKELNNIKYKP